MQLANLAQQCQESYAHWLLIPKMHQVVAEGGTLKGLHTQAPAGDPNCRHTLPAFSKEEFHRQLIAFIVSNNQVRML